MSKITSVTLSLDTIKTILARECQGRIDLYAPADMYMSAALHLAIGEIARIATFDEANAFTDNFMGMSVQDWADTL